MTKENGGQIIMLRLVDHIVGWEKLHLETWPQTYSSCSFRHGSGMSSKRCPRHINPTWMSQCTSKVWVMCLISLGNCPVLHVKSSFPWLWTCYSTTAHGHVLDKDDPSFLSIVWFHLVIVASDFPQKGGNTPLWYPTTYSDLISHNELNIKRLCDTK